jgi:hypothetical protein
MNMNMKMRDTKIKLVALVILSFTVSFASAGQIYTTYMGSQNGVTIRDSSTFSQLNFFDPGFVVDNIAAGNGNELYLTSDNGLYRYDTAGAQLAQLIFPDPGIEYNGISMAVSGNSIYSAYTGTQNGITVRDATTLAQTSLFNPGFVVDNITAGDNNDMFLTSGNMLYHYSSAGTQINSYTFPDAGIVYQGIAFAIPEPASLGLLGLISGGIYFSRRFFRA